MRNLALLLALLLLSAPAAAAQALSLPVAPADLAAAASEEGDEDEAGEEGELEVEIEDEEGDCTIEDEEDAQLCAEIAAEERESEEAEECLIEDATAKLVPHPGSDTVDLAIRYVSLAPAAVRVEAQLRGSKGRLRLGADRARLRRSGVYRRSFVLSDKEMNRALGAREFEVELQAVHTPRYCRLDLNGAPRRAKH
ncbi:MAG TPA: hypothetical protein VFN18_06955 [Solirubrobacterales bacterium]|nr:hypothetical protein [Solirubrobacterales bacterium]